MSDNFLFLSTQEFFFQNLNNSKQTNKQTNKQTLVAAVRIPEVQEYKKAALTKLY
jgi:hypothetical protein